MLNCVMHVLYRYISAAAGMAADRMKAFAAQSRAIHGSGVRWAAGSASALAGPTADLDIGAYPSRRLV
jgi:hypothetical protein